MFSDGKPRFIQIKGINIDAEIGRHMLYTTNDDVPGIIGTLGQTLGENGVNIANFTLGRSARGRTRSRCSTWTTKSRRRCWRNCGATGLSSRCARCSSTWPDVTGGRVPAKC